ncbi:MAG: hypothetical protein WCT52_06120 [Candidatus Micrarchaeia archaeon]|jgi:hypothetical protein
MKGKGKDSGAACIGRAKRGFVMSAEAMFALLFLSFAASSLFLFNFQRYDAEAFYLCSDAAIVLARTGAFSHGSLDDAAEELSALSGMCIKAQTDSLSPRPCPGAQAGEKISLTIPIWDGSQATTARITCSRPR